MLESDEVEQKIFAILYLSNETLAGRVSGSIKLSAEDYLILSSLVDDKVSNMESLLTLSVKR